MAIFTSNNVVLENDIPAVEGILPTMEASDQILYEFAEDMYKINAALYVSDVIIEQSVTEGAENPETLMENVVTDFFKKLVEAFKKLWAKIKGWFKEVIKSLEVLFMNGEKFIKKYKKELEDKKATGFKYKGFKYDVAKMETAVAGITTKATGYSNTNLGSLDGVSKEDLENRLGDIAKLTGAEFIEKVFGKATTDLKKDIVTDLRGGTDTQYELSDFEGFNKSAMISFVEGYKKCIDNVKKDAAEADKNLSNCIKAIESAGKSYKGEESGVTGVVSTVASNLKACVSVAQGMYALKQSAYKEVYKYSVHILKKYLTFKPAKESAFDDYGSESKSILESAMDLI